MADDLERRIRAAWDDEDMAAAAEMTLEGYGREVHGFLVTAMHSEQDATEVFAWLCEDLWRGIERFEWRSSMRTWLYTLARHAAARVRRDPQSRAERNLPLSQMAEIADRLRTATLLHLRTEVKSRFAQLRDRLEPDERELLVLRVDRKLPWDDIARIMADDEDADLKQVSARMRKRFQLVKDRLRQLAKEAGLLGGEGRQ
jgi:RNA polymerase sigma-70 factor (ECF subfamily)